MQPEPMIRFGYCERGSGEFWAEPANALSNGAFILAGIAGLLLWRRQGRRDGRGDLPAAVLIGLVFAIGIGSFLFHTMPRRWTLLADVIPIQLFAFGYFGLALRRFIGLSPTLAVAGTLAFLGASFALTALVAPALPPAARGSAGYAAFVLALFGVAAALWRREGMAGPARLICAAGFVFALSLTLRSLDPLACQHVPLGLHWLWHLLNALVLYLLLRAAIPMRPAR